MSTCGFSAEGSGKVTRTAQEGARSADQRAVCAALGVQTDWSDLGVSTHVMQVYEGEAHLLDTACRFTGTGLAGGEAAVVIATPSHRDQLEAHLRAQGVDLATARAQGQYVPLDAAETLAQFIVDGWPDAGRFARLCCQSPTY